MQKQEEKVKQLYEVAIIKYELQNSIIALSTDSYDVAFEKWQELTALWTKSVKEKVPMCLITPIVTAFDPATIKEISVRPVLEAPASKYENPYFDNMARNGLGKTLSPGGKTPETGHSDILDGGYR